MSAVKSPIRVHSLDHVTLVVRDLEVSRRFYVDALGMEQVDRPGFSFSGSWFQAGETQIHLILQHDESGPAGIHVPEHLASSRTHHFAFVVDDAWVASDHLKSLGYAIVSGPKARPDGAVQVFIEDPDGHVVELCQPPSADPS